MSKIAVVYLCWQPLGLSLYQRFLESYTSHPAGVKHDLIIVFKGDGYWFPEYEKRLPKGARSVYVSDKGYDIGAYRHAAEELKEYDYFCFLNSYSYILGGCGELNKSPSKGWLQIMYEWLVDKRYNVGLVGATGSWETAENLPPFPNYHIRTNAFMIRREDFLSCVGNRSLITREEGSLFEAGEDSMTRRILAMGKEARVVGRDKYGPEKENWHKTGTFRTGEQENLLVADNRTDHYKYGDVAMRQYLNTLAWGEYALPTLRSGT